jgi:hypothetical protein
MEETVGPVSTCGRELLQGWWQPIGRRVSFIIFTASVPNILDRPSYHSAAIQSQELVFYQRIFVLAHGPLFIRYI